MKEREQTLYEKAEKILRSVYGRNASFRDGQYEAIEATMTRRRTLVVQRTGWGKSLVYFICSKLIREKGGGTAIVVSPLLVLMNNQLEAAEKMGLRCTVLSGSVKDEREDILAAAAKGYYDLIIVTPETLFSDDVRETISRMNIGLFVVDEAHCISDWGHDFRMEYGRLRSVVANLPQNVPLLATTATANDRVIEDLKIQLGGDVYLSRGSLHRESLYIQVSRLPGKTERYAWILENLPKMPGSGIIYCLTRRDCEELSCFLKENGISAEAYYSREGEEDDETNRAIERKFQRNAIKAIVATVKLGMGYDKGDVAFVIHYQMPGSIVAYYQQIGRAGRNIGKAYVVLLCGKEDERILNYFIDTAFPSEKEATDVITAIGALQSVKRGDIEATLNYRRGRIEKALSFLTEEGFVKREKTVYSLTDRKFRYNGEHYAAVTETRRRETAQMREYTETKECYSSFIGRCLDERDLRPCGHCANCLGKPFFSDEVGEEYRKKAAAYIDGLVLPVVPRKMWAASDVTKYSRIPLFNREGVAMCVYGDAGFGATVEKNLEEGAEEFDKKLLDRSVEVLFPIVAENRITQVAYVPSEKKTIVRNFALRLAKALGLSFTDAIGKSPAPSQSEMQNGSFQCANAYRSFSAKEGVSVADSVLLVDDYYDSGWTLTVCGFRLAELGANDIFPFVLAERKR